MGALAQKQLSIFDARLPKKPYCTDDLGGLRILPKSMAIEKAYIQPNGPTHRYWIVFDIDREGAAVDWEDRGAPPPTIITVNTKNGHAHLVYGLDVPVRVARDGSGAALRFAAAVEAALCKKLGADLGYSGLITKNPLSPTWRVLCVNPDMYDLHSLSEWLDLSATSNRRKRMADYGLGRNCNLFDGLRAWAYKAIRQGWPDYERWLEAVEQRAAGINAGFNTPLSANECRGVAKSVAKWTHKNVTAGGFSAWQAAQGRKGGKAKGEAYAGKAAEARRMRAEGLTQAAIAEALSVSRMSISRWLSAECNNSHIR